MDRRQKKQWEREQRRRKLTQAQTVPLSNQARLNAAEEIMRLQDSGQITQFAASAMFDKLLRGETGTLAFYSDSTNLAAAWDKDVMLLAAEGSTAEKPIPSNTGIYVEGPKRGILVRKAGSGPEPSPEMMKHFLPGIIGREEL